jgi:DNA processing protein
MRRSPEGQGLFSYHTPFTPPTTEEDRLSWLRLIRSRRVGPATFHRLIAEHGTADAALTALPDLARGAGLVDYAPCPEGVALAELRAGMKLGARLLCHGSPGYPAALTGIADAPPVLWGMGDAALADRPAVALIGARGASSLGLRMARRLAGDLGAAGQVIVSGLARGIDAAAHDAALESGTIAVLAGGIDVVYPRENADLMRRIAERGLLVSEQPPGLDPQARHFPQRNRIVAGMTQAVVVVEAAAQSGSLITARMALDLGREVFAVPGHPFDGRAAGCNMLIRDGALLVRGAEDVLAALSPATAVPPRRPAHDRSAPGPVLPKPVAGPAPAPRLGTLALRILDRLGPSPLAEDQLIRDLALPAEAVAAALLPLELDGRVLRQPGGLLSLTG